MSHLIRRLTAVGPGTRTRSNACTKTETARARSMIHGRIMVLYKPLMRAHMPKIPLGVPIQLPRRYSYITRCETRDCAMDPPYAGLATVLLMGCRDVTDIVAFWCFWRYSPSLLAQYSCDLFRTSTDPQRAYHPGAKRPISTASAQVSQPHY